MQINSVTPKYLNNTSFKGLNAQTARKIAKETQRITKNTSDRTTSYMAIGLGKLASFKSIQNFVNYLKNKNYQEHLAAFVGCTLSGFYMLDTAKSKNIEKEQKPALILNQGVVCGISTTGAYTLNHYLNKKINHIAELFHIAKIQNKALQTKFLKFKADSEYANVVERAAQKNSQLKQALDQIKSKFEFTNNVKVYLKEEIKNFKNDETAKNFLKEIKNIIVENGKDKADTVKELYLKRMQQSKAMQAAFNREAMNNAIKKIAKAEGNGHLTKMMNGFKTAQALMVFALIYRFVSPVVATPIANNISEKLEARKQYAAKKA